MNTYGSIFWHQHNQENPEIVIRIAPDTNVHETIEAFVSFLKACSYSEEVIKKGLKEAVEE